MGLGGRLNHNTSVKAPRESDVGSGDLRLFFFSVVFPIGFELMPHAQLPRHHSQVVSWHVFFSLVSESKKRGGKSIFFPI